MKSREKKNKKGVRVSPYRKREGVMSSRQKRSDNSISVSKCTFSNRMILGTCRKLGGS